MRCKAPTAYISHRSSAFSTVSELYPLHSTSDVFNSNRFWPVPRLKMVLPSVTHGLSLGCGHPEDDEYTAYTFTVRPSSRIASRLEPKRPLLLVALMSPSPWNSESSETINDDHATFQIAVGGAPWCVSSIRLNHTRGRNCAMSSSELGASRGCRGRSRQV